MPSLKDIRARIETTKNTQQITKAMKLVSAAKLRKAQHQITNMRPYTNTLLKVIADIAVTNRVSHPLMTLSTDENKKVLLVVLTSDRGLAGAFNANINKFTETYYRDQLKTKEKIDFFFIGRRGLDYFARRKVVAVESILKLDKDVSYELASTVAQKLIKEYMEGHYDEIRLIYNEFKSAISQKVVSETLLPIDVSKATFEEGQTAFSMDMIYEPSPEKIVDQLLVKAFTAQVYRCMCESIASEHGARMSAMESATNNAKDMISKMTLTYNKLRQEKITTELIEIVSGAEALK
jgi:F-type H+-transporting ATPase subunit gamma